MNAHTMDASMVELTRDVFENDHIFVMTSAQDAADAAANIIADTSYSLVSLAGRDRTLTATIQAMCQAAIKRIRT
jgi:biotin carboxylase